MSASVTVRPGDSLSSPTVISSNQRRAGPVMSSALGYHAGRSPTAEPSPRTRDERAARSLDRADREARDEPVEEDVVEDGDGDAGDEAGGDERAPVVDVAADQRHRHPHG